MAKNIDETLLKMEYYSYIWNGKYGFQHNDNCGLQMVLPL